MTNDIRAPQQTPFQPRPELGVGSASGSVPSEVAQAVETYQQIQAEETLIFSTINQVDELTLQVKALEHELYTAPNKLSPEELVEKTQQLFALRQKLDLLLNPEGSLADAPGL